MQILNEVIATTISNTTSRLMLQITFEITINFIFGEMLVLIFKKIY